MLVNLNTFKGQNFAIPNHMLPLELGQVAKNMYIEDGRFVPMYATSFDPVSSHFTGNEQTLYQHRDINNNTKKWFTSNYWTPVVRHPNGSDIHQRIYFVENGLPKYKLYTNDYIYDLLLPALNPQDQLTATLSATTDVSSTSSISTSSAWSGALATFKCDSSTTRISTTSGSTGATAASSISLTINEPSDNNSLIAIISTRSTSSSTVSSITQTGVTWTKVTSSVNSSGTTTEIWYAADVVSAGTTVAIALASSLFATAIVAEYYGDITLNKYAGDSGTSATASIGSASGTAYDHEIRIGGIGLVNSTYTLGLPTNSFSTIDYVATTSSTAANNSKLYMQESIVSATGTIRRFIAYTLVTEYGDESTLSLVENGTDNYKYGNLFITNLALDTILTITWNKNNIIPSGGNYNGKITKIRFYMTPTEVTTDGYRFVGETDIANQTISIEEAGSDTPLQETLATEVKLTYDIFSSTNPCVSLSKTMFGSIIIADKSNIYVSDLYQPASFAGTNIYSVDSEIQGVYPFGSSIAVFTTTVPSVFTGNSPETLTVEKAEQARAVSNIKCVVNTDDYIVFPTDEGIYVIGTGVYKLATDGVITKRNWEDLTNKGAYLLSATHYKDQYILLLTTGKAYIFDFLRGFFSESTFANPSFILNGDIVEDTNILHVSYYDSIDQELYGIPTGRSSNSIFIYEGSDSQLTGTFKSKRFILNRPYSMKYLRVLADDFVNAEITINLYFNGDLFQSVTVTSDKIYKLKSQITREMEIEIISNVTLRNVFISDNLGEIQGV